MLHCVTHTGEVCPTLSHLLRTNTHRRKREQGGGREREGGTGGVPTADSRSGEARDKLDFSDQPDWDEILQGCRGCDLARERRSPNDALLAL